MTRRRHVAAGIALLTAGAGCAVAVETVPPPAPAAAPARAEGAAPAADVGYALGYRIGGGIVADHRGMGLDVDAAALARGLADAVTGARPALDEARFGRAVGALEALLAERQAAFAARMREAARTNLARGKEFLATNAKRPGVVVRPSGLQYEVLEEGTGPVPGAADVVSAHYRGTHIDGREFDATDPSGEPARFPLRAVVPGWQEALPLMKAGSKWRLWIPAELGYGAEGSPPAIEPNEVLVFDIELVKSEPDSRAEGP